MFEGTIQLVPDGDWWRVVVEMPDGSFRHVGHVDIDWDIDQIEAYVDEWYENEYE